MIVELPDAYGASIMMPRRVFLSLASGGLCAAAKQSFTRPLGLQLYSLRREAAKDLSGTLALIRELGFTELEVGEFYGHTASEFQRMLNGHGLKATSMGAGWQQLSTSVKESAEAAGTLGVEYVTCSQIPRKKQLTVEDATRAAENLNRWGEVLAAAKLRLCYHIHGYEFVDGPDGTLFDTLAQHMDPKLANFEMDVFWVVFGNEDPVTLLERYSGRFPLMHVKDIRKGEARTFNPGTVAEEASVPLGTGEVAWSRVLEAARKQGVQHYYLEEEHPNAVAQIRQSLQYLQHIRF
jgi:sugar phosphate isomerase/epimerase